MATNKDPAKTTSANDKFDPEYLAKPVDDPNGLPFGWGTVDGKGGVDYLSATGAYGVGYTDLTKMIRYQADGSIDFVSTNPDGSFIFNNQGVIGVDTISGASHFTVKNFEQLKYRTLQLNADGTVATDINGNNATVDVWVDLAAYITGFSPNQSGIGVSVANNIVLTFNEAITRGATGFITIKDAAGNVIETFDAATSDLLIFDGKTVTINPSNNLPANTQYFVTADAGVVNGTVQGHIFTGIAPTGSTTAYSFTTAVAGVDVNTFLATATTAQNVVDSTANIVANIAALEANVANIKTISLTDVGTVFTISYDQLVSNKEVLALINGGNYKINVTGVTVADATSVLADAAHVASISLVDSSEHVAAAIENLDLIQGKISSITLLDASEPLTITADQMLDDKALLAKLNGGNYQLNVTGVSTDDVPTVLADPEHVKSIVVSDTGIAIERDLKMLASIQDKISSIVLGDDDTFEYYPFQERLYGNVLAKIVNVYLQEAPVPIALSEVVFDALVLNDSIAISDTVAHVLEKIVDIQGHITNISSITLTDATPLIQLNAAYIVAYADVLNKINTYYSLQVEDAKPLALSVDQLSADTRILSAISDGYSLAVTDTVAKIAVNLESLIANPHVVSVDIADKATSLSANLDYLRAQLAHIHAVIVTDAQPIAVTVKQISTFAPVFAKFDAYQLNVSGVVVKDLATLVAKAHVNGVSIGDTSAHVNASLDTLKLHVDKILDINTGKVDVLQLTADKLTHYAAVIDKIKDYSVVVKDSADHVVNPANLAVLHSHLDHIKSIDLTKKVSVIALSADQFVANHDVLDKIKGSFSINIDADATDSAISFSRNTQGAPSANHFDRVVNFTAHDTIGFSDAKGAIALSDSSLPVKVAFEPKSGLASINTETGVARFDSHDNTLAKQISAVEKALGLAADHKAGQFAIWTNPSNPADTEILIRDAHEGKSIVGDELIQLVGVTTAQLHLTEGVLHI